jgi:hypothetical protein
MGSNPCDRRHGEVVTMPSTWRYDNYNISGKIPPVSKYKDIACGPHNAHHFYPRSGGNSGARAREICIEVCPHLQECLVWAVRTRQMHGIWGGTDGSQRAALAKKLGLQWNQETGEVIDDEAVA